MTDRKKPGVAFWATVVIVAVLAYPLSFGPACSLTDQEWCPLWLLGAYHFIYWPMLRVLESGPEWLTNAILWWVGIFDSTPTP
jgi:hypothetical protein